MTMKHCGDPSVHAAHDWPSAFGDVPEFKCVGVRAAPPITVGQSDYGPIRYVPEATVDELRILRKMNERQRLTIIGLRAERDAAIDTVIFERARPDLEREKATVLADSLATARADLDALKRDLAIERRQNSDREADLARLRTAAEQKAHDLSVELDKANRIACRWHSLMEERTAELVQAREELQRVNHIATERDEAVQQKREADASAAAAWERSALLEQRLQEQMNETSAAEQAARNAEVMRDAAERNANRLAAVRDDHAELAATAILERDAARAEIAWLRDGAGQSEVGPNATIDALKADLHTAADNERVLRDQRDAAVRQAESANHAAATLQAEVHRLHAVEAENARLRFVVNDDLQSWKKIALGHDIDAGKLAAEQVTYLNAVLGIG